MSGHIRQVAGGWEYVTTHVVDVVDAYAADEVYPISRCETCYALIQGIDSAAHAEWHARAEQ